MLSGWGSWVASGVTSGASKVTAFWDELDLEEEGTAIEPVRDWKAEFPINARVQDFVEAIAEHGQTFINFPTSAEDDNFTLSEAQESHARAILDHSEPLRLLRHRLCPGCISEDKFWRVYFVLLGNIYRKDRFKQEDGPVKAEMFDFSAVDKFLAARKSTGIFRCEALSDSEDETELKRRWQGKHTHSDGDFLTSGGDSVGETLIDSDNFDNTGYKPTTVNIAIGGDELSAKDITDVPVTDTMDALSPTGTRARIEQLQSVQEGDYDSDEELP